MSLSDEERRIMVALEIERARKIKSEFPVYQQNALWSTLANRMYYAVYHAAMALLIANGLHAGTHQGVYVLLNQYFIKENLLSAEYGSLCKFAREGVPDSHSKVYQYQRERKSIIFS